MNPLERMAEIKKMDIKKIHQKWKATGLLDDIAESLKNPVIGEPNPRAEDPDFILEQEQNVAVLLENQAQYMNCRTFGEIFGVSNKP